MSSVPNQAGEDVAEVAGWNDDVDRPEPLRSVDVVGHLSEHAPPVDGVHRAEMHLGDSDG